MAVTSRGAILLRDGGTPEVLLLTAPVDEALAEEVHAFINRDLSEPYHYDALRGALDPEASMRYFAAMHEGRVIATCWYSAAPAYPATGCMAGVATSELHRRKGLARNLCRLAMEDFLERGGVAMMLASANDIAAQIYERLGFRTLQGRIMRFATGGRDVDREYFAPASVRRVQPARWCDMARVTPLYLYPHAWSLLDAKVNLASQRYAPGHRCVGVFLDIWGMVHATRGSWQLLEAEGGRIVGAAALYPETAHSAVVDFVIHPNHLDGAAQLFEALADEARARGLSRLDCRLAAQDEEKARLAAAHGFVDNGDNSRPRLGLLTRSRPVD